jgi:hypothetical protein
VSGAPLVDRRGHLDHELGAVTAMVVAGELHRRAIG